MKVILNFELIFLLLAYFPGVQAANRKRGMTVWLVTIFLFVVIDTIVLLLYRSDCLR